VKFAAKGFLPSTKLNLTAECAEIAEKSEEQSVASIALYISAISAISAHSAVKFPLKIRKNTGGVNARIGWLVLLAVVGGCAKLPFAAEPLPTLVNPDPATMRDSFARGLPNRFTTDDTIIIHAPFHDDLAVLGVLRVDRPAGTFELIALNHLGIKLFDLSGDREKVSIGYLLPPLMGLKDVLMWIGRDIGRMYLDVVPSEGAKVEIGSNEILFIDKESAGTVVYEFGGDPAVLREKWQKGFFGTPWDVRYFQYSTQFGGLYPRGVVMDNGRYHYRIIVKNRDVEIDR